MKAVDEINRKFGKDTVKFASLLHGDTAAWRMKQIYKSPSYTTNWNELLTVG
jgi:DNA polymerase V